MPDMGFLKVSFCFVITLVMMNLSVLGQYQSVFQNTNPVNKFPESISNFNPLANNPLYQSVMNQVEKAINQNNQLSIPQFQPFNNQPSIPQYQQLNNQPERFSTYNPASNNPPYQSSIGQPGNFNNYNNQPNPPQYSRSPQYQTTGYQPRKFGSIPSNPQYESFSNQPGGSNTDRSDQSPGQQLGSINAGYNPDLNTPRIQQPNDTPQTVTTKKTESDGHRLNPTRGQSRKVQTKKTRSGAPKRRSSGDSHRVTRTHGPHTNGFRSSSSIEHPVIGSTFTHSSSSPSNHSFSHYSSGPHSGQVHRNDNAKPISQPSASQSSPPDNDPLMGYRIVCLFNNKHYYRNEFSPAYIDASLCTHLNYEFAILDPNTYEMIPGEPSLDIQMNFFEMTCNLRKWNPKLVVLISLGGWQDSTEKYSILAADEEKRKNFVATAVTFIKKHGFDGMDFAWEYPNCWKGALGSNPEDKQNYVLLLKELRSAFDEYGWCLSVSVGAVKREVDAAYDVSEITKYVHFINVMTYDMHGPWEFKTGHHTQFEMMPGDEDPYCNVKAAMKMWADKGAEKKKLNLGIALYGKTFTLADPYQNGMQAPVTGIGDTYVDTVEGGFVLYNKMCEWLNSGNWTEREHKQAGFYAYCDDQWACYDPPMMIVRKTKHVMEAGYGGVLFKDLGGDDYQGSCFSMPFPLLKMARFEMIHKIRAWKRAKDPRAG